MKKLLVDMGGFVTTYVIKDEGKIEYFEVIETKEFHIDSIVTKRTYSDLNRIQKHILKLLSNNPEVKQIDILIPSRDMLIKSPKPVEEQKISYILDNDLQITKEDNLNVGIGKLFKASNNYYAPISLYDAGFDTSMNSIATNYPGVEVKLYSPISVLLNIAGSTKGKAWIVDSSYSNTKILTVDNGVPIKYEIVDFSGDNLIRSMIADSEKTLVDIQAYIADIANPRLDELPEVINGRAYLSTIRKNVLLPKAKEAGIDTIVEVGGMCETKIFRGLLPNVKTISHEELIIGDTGVPEEFKYKLMPINYFPTTESLNSIVNIETLRGLVPYKDMTEATEMEPKLLAEYSKESREIVGDDSKYFSEDLYSAIRGSEINKEKFREMSDERNIEKSQEYKTYGKDKAFAKLDVKEENNGNNPILEYHVADKEERQQLNAISKQYKKLSWRESSADRVIVFIFGLIVSAFLLVAAHNLGYIRSETLEKIGIENQTVIDEHNKVSAALKDKYNSMVKNSKLNEKNFQYVTLQKEDGIVSIAISVPATIPTVDNIDKWVKGSFYSMGYKDSITVERMEDQETDKTFAYKITVKFK